jgi:hypothetical protein
MMMTGCMSPLFAMQLTEEQLKLSQQVDQQQKRIDANLRLEKEQVAKLLARSGELAVLEGKIKQVSFVGCA